MIIETFKVEVTGFEDAKQKLEELTKAAEACQEALSKLGITLAAE